jgi:hypothetical protein
MSTTTRISMSVKPSFLRRETTGGGGGIFEDNFVKKKAPLKTVNN